VQQLARSQCAKANTTENRDGDGGRLGNRSDSGIADSAQLRRSHGHGSPVFGACASRLVWSDYAHCRPAYGRSTPRGEENVQTNARCFLGGIRRTRRSKRNAQASPNVCFEVVADAGHAVFIDQPEQFNRLLEDFVRKVEQRLSHQS